MRKNKIKILLVEENYDICLIMSDYIINQPDMNLLTTAFNKDYASKALLHQIYDVILMDVDTHNLNDLDLIRQAKTVQTKIKPTFIVLSAIGNENIVREAINMGADYFFFKPFKLKILFEYIRSLNLT